MDDDYYPADSANDNQPYAALNIQQEQYSSAAISNEPVDTYQEHTDEQLRVVEEQVEVPKLEDNLQPIEEEDYSPQVGKEEVKQLLNQAYASATDSAIEKTEEN